MPLLIVHGGQDLQVAEADARALAAARRDAELRIIPEMSHALKPVEGEGRAANLATYADPSAPVDPGLVDAIADFVKR